MKKLTGIGLCCIVTCFFSCHHSKLDDTTLVDAAEYYPLHLGNFIVYAVDTMHYHEILPDDTVHYEVKEVIADTFYDNENRLNYTIERYMRQSDTAEFVISNVWSVLYTGHQIQKVENNLRYVKLVTPVDDEETWEGHIYLGGLEDIHVEEACNNMSFLEDWSFEYTMAGQPFSVDDFYFDQTVTVEESGSINLIEYNYSKEVYAKGVGLVYKEFYHYTDDDVDCPDCTWPEHVECGYAVIMKVIEF